MRLPRFILLRYRARRAAARAGELGRATLSGSLAGLAIVYALAVFVLCLPLLCVGVLAWLLWPSAPAAK